MPGDGARQQRLTGAGRPAHQHVVSAGRSHLDRALDVLLTADIAEIDLQSRHRIRRGWERRPIKQWERGVAASTFDEVSQRGDRLDLGPLDQRGFRGVDVGERQPPEALVAHHGRHRQGARDVAEVAV